MSKVTLGEVAMEARESTKDPSGLPVVGLEHLVPGELRLAQWSESSENTFTKLFHKGQVLFGRRRAYQKKAAIADFDGVCSGDITVIAARPDRLLPELLPFIISDDRFFDFAMEKSAGSLSPRVKWAQLAEYTFCLPESLEEQRRLATLLWSMERTRSAYRNLLIQMDELVKSQFVEMFGIPEANVHGYPIGTIGEVSSDVHYGTSKKAEDNGRFTYLRMNNITYGGELDLTDVKFIDLPEKELEGCLVRRGDVLFNRTNSKELVGKTCAFMLDSPMVIAGYIIRLRMNGRVTANYLSTFMNLPSSKKMLMAMAKGAVGQANINAQEVQAISIVVPPMPLQQEFEVLLSETDKSKLAIRQALESLEKSRTAIMNRIFG